MKDLQGERMLLEANNKVFTLTTHRVRYAVAGRGQARVVSLMLEAVTTCELTHTTYPLVLAVAALFLVGGALISNNSSDSSPLIGGLLIAAVLVTVYFVTRRQVLRVASPSSHFDLLLTGMSLDNATAVIDSIQQAQDARRRS